MMVARNNPLSFIKKKKCKYFKKIEVVWNIYTLFYKLHKSIVPSLVYADIEFFKIWNVGIYNIYMLFSLTKKLNMS